LNEQRRKLQISAKWVLIPVIVSEL
jgi:hypothetical protein